MIGGACEIFNRRAIAALVMVCVLAGFTGVVFTRHYHAERFIASESPTETLYHAAEIHDGKLASNCIHAPRSGSIRRFRSEEDARKTGRVPCRCVVRDGQPYAVVSLPMLAKQKK
jgi:hypothetical protein